MSCHPLFRNTHAGVKSNHCDGFVPTPNFKSRYDIYMTLLHLDGFKHVPCKTRRHVMARCNVFLSWGAAQAKGYQGSTETTNEQRHKPRIEKQTEPLPSNGAAVQPSTEARSLPGQRGTEEYRTATSQPKKPIREGSTTVAAWGLSLSQEIARLAHSRCNSLRQGALCDALGASVKPSRVSPGKKAKTFAGNNVHSQGSSEAQSGTYAPCPLPRRSCACLIRGAS